VAVFRKLLFRDHRYGPAYRRVPDRN